MPLEAVAPELVAVPAVKRQAPRWLRVVFSFPVALSALLCVLMVLTVRGRFNDPDMWWHLKTGEIIWNTHHIPTVDTFSYTTHNHAYIPHEWLSQLTIYGAYHFGGYTGMMLWLCVLGSLLLIAGYALCSVYSGNAKVAFVGAMVIWLFSTVGLSIRPQMIGYLLLVCELLILHFGRTRNARWFFLLPPLFALWVNCHGSFFLGFVVAAILLACSFLEFRMGLMVSARWEKRPRNLLLVALALSVAALFVNPIGWQQVTYPLDTMFHQSIGLQSVDEWKPPSFDDARSMVLILVESMVLLIPIMRRRRIQLQDLLLVAMGFKLGIQHQRMLFVFGLFVAPVLCRLLSDEWDQYSFKKDRIVPNAAFVVIAMLCVAFAFPANASLEQQVRQGNPLAAVGFLQQSERPARMLNEYVYGGFLIWTAPNHKVFVDGRSDVYEWTGVLRDYWDCVLLRTDPEKVLRKYQVNLCLLSKGSPLIKVLKLIPSWHEVYSDAKTVIWTKTT